MRALEVDLPLTARILSKIKFQRKFMQVDGFVHCEVWPDSQPSHKFASFPFPPPLGRTRRREDDIEEDTCRQNGEQNAICVYCSPGPSYKVKHYLHY